ncbi:GIY-YIG nuclease family protein [Undibacterium baiyunense]|uniref:GIY-YIG nuclease family protein n=1 Tax=Undibacterium baiyunense TaxID=2828731 RepID=A0A941DCB9_9BURK|nr:GIY-YIG nuclease family protein [Undibacterium baiyunense]MBR7746113.1 GIY-YIG nuclease family protein [Undibacterium baiyunense]
MKQDMLKNQQDNMQDNKQDSTQDKKQDDQSSGQQNHKHKNKKGREDYKQQDDRAGIYRVHNIETGMQWIDSSADVQGAINRMQFELKLGSHRRHALQADFKVSAGKALQFDILERICKKVDPSWNLQEALEQARTLWREEFAASGAFYGA